MTSRRKKETKLQKSSQMANLRISPDKYHQKVGERKSLLVRFIFKTKRGWSDHFYPRTSWGFIGVILLPIAGNACEHVRGTWGFLLPHGGVGHRNRRKEAIYHSQGSILDSQVLTYQFLRFCLWHIFQAFPNQNHQVNILNCNFCSSTIEAAGGV